MSRQTTFKEAGETICTSGIGHYQFIQDKSHSQIKGRFKSRKSINRTTHLSFFSEGTKGITYVSTCLCYL